jgi:hypothetical protein
MTNNKQADNNIVVQEQPYNSKMANLNIKDSSEGIDLQFHGKNSLKSVHENYLKVPQLSTRVWAANILKTFKPASFIVCFNILEVDNGNEMIKNNEWSNFFMRAWESFPRIQFLLLNYSLDWSKEFAIDIPNVTITKMLGYNLLEEFALVQSADMYMGSYDKYAAAVVGTEKPFLLFGLNEAKANTLMEFFALTSRQILITENISPDYLFQRFTEFYSEISSQI